jgi:hypothetical protein
MMSEMSMAKYIVKLVLYIKVNCIKESSMVEVISLPDGKIKDGYFENDVSKGNTKV